MSINGEKSSGGELACSRTEEDADHADEREDGEVLDDLLLRQVGLEEGHQQRDRLGRLVQRDRRGQERRLFCFFEPVNQSGEREFER